MPIIHKDITILSAVKMSRADIVGHVIHPHQYFNSKRKQEWTIELINQQPAF